MRVIKFRGLRTDGKGWVHGDLRQTQESVYISNSKNSLIQVIPESVGQFTGLKDKNGVDVFESDVIRFAYNEKERQEVIEFRAFAFTVGLDFNFYLSYLVSENIELEVIGKHPHHPLTPQINYYERR